MFAVPRLTAPAALAGGGVEVGVLLVVAVRDANSFPLAVVERGSIVVMVGMSDALWVDKQFTHGGRQRLPLFADGRLRLHAHVAPRAFDGQRPRRAHHHGGIAHCAVDSGDVVFLIGGAGTWLTAGVEGCPLLAIEAEHHCDAGCVDRVAWKLQLDAAERLASQ